MSTKLEIAKQQVLIGLGFILIVLFIDRLVNLITENLNLEYDIIWTLIPLIEIIRYIYFAIDEIAWKPESSSH